MTLVSVIVPVYNVDLFLNRCLDSIKNQTYSNLEVICINDGSDDDSLRIIHDYVLSDSRFSLISTSNQGAGCARNLGLRIARGDYIIFLDSDDFFEVDMIEKALKTISDTSSDICVFRSNTFDYTSRQYISTDWTINSDLLPAQEFSPRDVHKNIFKLFVGWAWDKLYKTSFLRKNHLEFQPLRTTNDMYFTLMSIVLANKIVINDSVLAHHQRGYTSLANTREKSWDCFYCALSQLREGLINNHLFELYQLDFINYALHECIWNLNTLKEPARELLFNKLKSEWFDDLGITMISNDNCYNSSEFNTYKKIIKSTYHEFTGGASL